MTWIRVRLKKYERNGIKTKLINIEPKKTRICFFFLLSLSFLINIQTKNVLIWIKSHFFLCGVSTLASVHYWRAVIYGSVNSLQRKTTIAHRIVNILFKCIHIEKDLDGDLLKWYALPICLLFFLSRRNISPIWKYHYNWKIVFHGRWM